MKLKERLSLIGQLISGYAFLVLPLRYYRKKVEQNQHGLMRQLRAVDSLIEIQQILVRKDYMEIYEQFADPEVKEGWRNSYGLNTYFSLLNLCACMLHEKVICDTEIYSLLGNRLECLRGRKDVCAYLRNSSTDYNDLIWFLEAYF